MRQGNHEGCPYVGQTRFPSVIAAPASARGTAHPTTAGMFDFN